MNLIVEVERFSGPLDLLLYLIRKEEMDIFDINIGQITKQYLDSIKQMKKLNLEVAGDFVAMAATLIQIKAKMLVPQYDEEGEVLEEEDPRKDLVRRLLEYQAFQDAGKRLYDRSLVGRDVLLRGKRESIEAPEGELIIEEDNALYALIASYRGVVKKMNKAVHTVAKSLKSIRERIMEIRYFLTVGKRVEMSTLYERETDDPQGTKLITFLSCLELAKLGLVSLFQSNNFEEIHIEAKTHIDEDVIAKVENYGGAENIGESSEIWVMEEDREDPPEPQVEAATDEEILAEEQAYESQVEEVFEKDAEV